MRGDDGSGMLIEKYEDGEFVEHLLAGVASGYDEEEACTMKDEQGHCTDWTYKMGWDQSYARTDGKALGWINKHIKYFSSEEIDQADQYLENAFEDCEYNPWFPLWPLCHCKLSCPDYAAVPAGEDQIDSEFSRDKACKP